MVSAADAVRIGLVNRVVPAGEERAEAMRLARRIASRSPAAIRTGKQAFYAQREMGLATELPVSYLELCPSIKDVPTQPPLFQRLAVFSRSAWVKES